MNLSSFLTALAFSQATVGTTRQTRGDNSQLTTEALLRVAPKSISCAGKGYECRTADQALPFIKNGLLKYGIQDPGPVASILALIAVESAELEWKHNASPGRPGQGTANMQSAKFNPEYAKSLSDCPDLIKAFETVDGLSNSQLNSLLNFLTPNDDYNFSSAAWFLRTQCGEDIIQALLEDVDQGFKKHMECIHVDIDEIR